MFGNCWTWENGRLELGLRFTLDERLGSVVFLGEEGRGRRYEKVALDRKNPPECINMYVREAHPVKITLPPKDGKPERVFYVLGRRLVGNAGVLVRIDTNRGYIRNADGRWTTVEGSPENLVAGYGAFGDAGRVGSWSDGIVMMRAGDVIRIRPTRGEDFALWIESDRPVTASWQDYQNLQAAAKAAAVITEAEGKPETLEIVSGVAPCFTYTGGGNIRSGIEVGKGVAGPAVLLGEKGRGRKLTEIPLVGEFTADIVETIAIVRLSAEIVGFTNSDTRAKAGTVIVRVNPVSSVHRQYMRCEEFLGNPKKIAEGMFAGGDAGYAGSVDDTLWTLAPGDAVVIRSDKALRVIENRDGLVAPSWNAWELADCKANPAKYHAEGRARFDNVPAEWVGKVVEVKFPADSSQYLGPVNLVEIHSDTLMVNKKWEGKGEDETFIAWGGEWVVLRPDISPEPVRENERAEEFVRFAEPPVLEGRHPCSVVTDEHGYKKLVVLDMSCERVRRLRWTASGVSQEAEEVVARETGTWSYAADDFHVSLKEIPDGDYSVYFTIQTSGRFRGTWNATVVTPELAAEERARVAEELATGFELKSRAVWIPETEFIYGAKRDDGSWLLYERRYPNRYLEPETWVLVPMKGYRSQSEGATLELLIRDYFRGDPETIGKSLAALRLDGFGFEAEADETVEAEEETQEPVLPPAEDTTVEKIGVVFQNLGKRNFRCGYSTCGRADRLTKEEDRKLASEGEVEITCPGCGGVGTLRSNT